MRTLLVAVLIVGLAIQILPSPVQAQKVTNEEAQIIADNWISLVIHAKGSWGGSPNAEVADIQEFKRGERIIGYFCQVKPQGYIVISLYTGLAPVKTYSETSDLDPESEEGMADLIKLKMAGILDQSEQLVGPLDTASTEDLDDILEVNYRSEWTELGVGTQTFTNRLQSGEVQANYQGGQILLTSNWHQGPPYNDQCPNLGCSHPWCDYYNSNALVGCAAICGAQTMRYWNWPPYRSNPSDTFDWPRMINNYNWDPWSKRWEDEKGNPLTLAHINAVAELCYEVGVEAGTEYGCSESSAYFSSYDGKDLLDTFEDHFRYSDKAEDPERDDDYSADEWFEDIQVQLNLNRPIPYRVTNHAIVCDGWQVLGGTRQYHMNYGWGGASTGWYTLDALHLGGAAEEVMLTNIYPAPALGSSLSAVTYSRPSFPYRYFDQDATGASATFEAGQNLQFLPNVEVTCTSNTGGSIQFLGSSSYNTRLYTRGDPSKGIRIYQGEVKLDKDGSIKLP